MKILKQKFGPATEKEMETREMESTSLVRGCSVFSAVTLNVADCQRQANLILRALFSSYKFSPSDIETIFISLTQAYHNKDLLLHRLLLLVLRNLRVPPDFSMMITQSLANDMHSDLIMNRARTTRLLPHILALDGVFTQEQSIKQAILAHEPLVSSAGLSCALTLCFKGAVERVKRMVPEIHSAISSPAAATQYLAYLVLYFLRRGDGNFLRKMVDQRRDTNDLTSHVLIQICAEASKLTGCDNKFIVAKLQSASNATQLDAVRAILANDSSSAENVGLAVKKLNNMLSSPSNVAVFAALRTIGQYAANRRDEFSKCNAVLECILNSNEGTSSTLAAVALLHTGSESTVDRVLPSIASFATQLGFDQQASLLKSCVEVTRRHPSKLERVLDFVWSTFRTVENLQVQQILVDCFFKFAESIESSRVAVFRFLCEYLEDSKFAMLSVRIVNFIGKWGNQLPNKSELVRSLCNRLFLESAEVRAATIDALFQFIGDDTLGASVRSVIARQLNDPDDEVRDRATFYTQVLATGYSDLLDLSGDVATSEKAVVVVEAQPETEDALLEGNVIKATQDDDEFVVSFTPKLYADRVVLVFSIKNTLDTAVHRVTVERIRAHEGGVQPSEVMPCEVIKTNAEGTVQLVYKGGWQDPGMLGSFACTILFFLEDDLETEQTYDLPNGADLKMAAFMKPTRIHDFDSTFAQLACQARENFKFEKAMSQDDAVKVFTEAVGLTVVSKEKVVEAKRQCMFVKLVGMAFGSHLVLATLLIPQPLKSGGVVVNVTIKADSEQLVSAVVRSFD
jgi:hypothetical protein